MEDTHEFASLYGFSAIARVHEIQAELSKAFGLPVDLVDSTGMSKIGKKFIIGRAIYLKSLLVKFNFPRGHQYLSTQSKHPTTLTTTPRKIKLKTKEIGIFYFYILRICPYLYTKNYL